MNSIQISQGINSVQEQVELYNLLLAVAELATMFKVEKKGNLLFFNYFCIFHISFFNYECLQFFNTLFLL